VKKNFLYILVVSVSMISITVYTSPVAASGDSALTTKGYVDAGLQHVYDIANGTSSGTVQNLQNALSDESGDLIDVVDLQNAIGTPTTIETPGTGLTGKVENLQKTVGNANSGLIKRVNALEANKQTYTAGNGIDITPGTNPDDPTTIGLDMTTSANTTYIFKTDANGTGTWQALKIQNDWDPGF